MDNNSPTNTPLPSTNCYNKPNITTIIDEPQPSTSGYKHTAQSSLNQHPSFTQLKVYRKANKTPINILDGPKKDFNEKALPKVSRLSGILQKIHLKKTKEICDEIRVMDLTSFDIQGQVESLTAQIFLDNRYIIEGGIVNEPEGERTDFFKLISYGLHIPKYPKNKGITEAYVKEFKPKEIIVSVVKENLGSQTFNLTLNIKRG